MDNPFISHHCDCLDLSVWVQLLPISNKNNKPRRRTMKLLFFKQLFDPLAIQSISIQQQQQQYQISMLNSKSLYEQQSQAYKHFIFHQYPQSLQLYTQCLKNPTLQPVAQLSIEAVICILHMQMHNYNQAHQNLSSLEEKLNTYISKFSQSQRKQSYMQSLLIYIKVKICLMLIQMLNCHRNFVEQHLQDIFKLIKKVDQGLKKKLWTSLMLMLFGADSFEQLYRAADSLVSTMENEKIVKPQLSQQSPLLLTCLSLVVQLAKNNELAYQIQYHCHQSLNSQVQPQIISLLISCKHMIHLCEVLGYSTAKQSYRVQFTKLMNTPQIYGINQQTLFRGYNEKIEIGKWIVEKLMGYENMIINENKNKMSQIENQEIIFIKWLHNKVIYKLEKLLYEIETNPRENSLIEKQNLIHTLHCLSSKNGYQILGFMLESQLVKQILIEEEEKLNSFVGGLRKILVANVWKDLVMLPPRVSHREYEHRQSTQSNSNTMGLAYDYKVFKNRNQQNLTNQKNYRSASPYEQEGRQKYRRQQFNPHLEKNNYMSQNNKIEEEQFRINQDNKSKKQSKQMVGVRKGNQDTQIEHQPHEKVSKDRRKNNVEEQDYSRDQMEERETSRSKIQLNQKQKKRRKVQHVNIIEKSPIKNFNYREVSNSPYERQKKFQTNKSHLTIEKHSEDFEQHSKEYPEESEFINLKRGKNELNSSKMGSYMNTVYLEPEKSRMMRPFEQYLDEGAKPNISNYNNKVEKSLHPKFEKREPVKNTETGNEQKIISILKSQNSRVKEVGSELQKEKVNRQLQQQGQAQGHEQKEKEKKITLSKESNKKVSPPQQQLEKLNNHSKLGKFTNIFTDPLHKNSSSNSNFNFNQQGDPQKPPTLTYTNSTVIPITKINKENISKDINFLKNEGSNIISKVLIQPVQKLTHQSPLIRKLMKICSEGQYFVKRHYSSDGGQMKFVQLTTNMLKWGVDQEKIATKFQSYKLKDIKGLVYGKVTDTFLKQCNQKLSSWLCFSLILQSRTLDFYCTDQVDPSIWLPGLTAALAGQTITLKYPKNKKKKTEEKIQEIEVKLFSPGRVLWKRILMKAQQRYLKPLKKHQKGSKCPNARAILMWQKQFLKKHEQKG